MAPRKKRSKGTKKVINQTKLEKSLSEEPTSGNSVDQKTNEPSKHKKFGKFRYLEENSCNSAENLQMNEDSMEIPLQNSEINFGIVEVDALESESVDIRNSDNDFVNETELFLEDNRSMENSIELDSDEMGKAKIDPEGIVEQNMETLTVVSEQFANLKVQNQYDVIFDPLHIEQFTNEYEKVAEFNVNNVESECMVECVSEEVIPVSLEEEVEISSLCDVEVQGSSAVDQPIAANIINEHDDVQEATTKTSKSKKRNTKSKATTKKKSTPKVNKKSITQNPQDTVKSDPIESSIRRSSRIKSINVLKQRSKGQGLVKSNVERKKSSKNGCNDSDTSENSNSCQTDLDKSSVESPSFAVPFTGCDSDQKPVKVKSRWRRSSELEMVITATKNSLQENVQTQTTDDLETEEKQLSNEENISIRLKQFVHLKENQYLTTRMTCKEAKKMVCDCFLTPEEMERGEMGCGEDCLNRLLMLECGPLCPVNDRCTNKRFQKSKFLPCEVFHTDKKGLGIRATESIPYGEFILEYVGEVIGPDEFEDRATEYSKDKNPHYYFMSLRSDAVIDATQKGNISRFINHSCEPNAETQKWTVNGELRIGFFSKRTILAGEEITFDYQFQRYGKEAQKCFCEAPTCRGWLGEEPDDDDEEEEEEEEVKKEPEELQEVKETQVSEDIVIKLHAEVEIQTDDIVPHVTADVEPQEVEVIMPVKKEKRKAIIRKALKDIFDNVDVGEEIDMLVGTGLKNQAQTLKLSRLMVRANEISQKSKLLRVLRHGEFPCRRLFLDYHGLRLIYGWMNEAQQLCKIDKKQESLRLELLQTLATLPIPNKTMLQDSKVLPTVEKWSTKIDDITASLDSESNSPQTEMESPNIEISKTSTEIKEQTVEINKVEEESSNDKDIRRSVGMDVETIRTKAPWVISSHQKSSKLVQDIIDMFEEDLDSFQSDDLAKCSLGTKQEGNNYEVEIVALALKLLEEWSILKEVFRIPKKERIEQMKEHEREADRGYKAGLEHDSERKSGIRYRTLQRHRSNEKMDERARKSLKMEDKNGNLFPKINKHERRKLFAMRVHQEEVEKKLIKSQDMWRQHEMQCMSYDPTRNYQFMWNPQHGQWQNYPINILNTGMPTRFNPPLHYSINTVTNMPPPNITRPLSVANIPIPNIPPSLPHMINAPSTMACPPPNMQHPPPNILHPPTNIPPPIMSHLSQTNMDHQIPNMTDPNLSSSLCIQNLPTNIPPPNIVPSLPASQVTSMSNNGSILNNLTQLHNGPIPLPNMPSVNQHMPNLNQIQQTQMDEKQNVEQVQFAGPIPPPAKLPPKWKCAKDKYNRPYYYHIKIRISQWEPPKFPEEEEMSDSTSSSDTSSLSSDSSSADSDEEDLDDNKLLLNIQKKFQPADSILHAAPTKVVEAPPKQPSPDDFNISKNQELDEIDHSQTSLDERLKEEFKLQKSDTLQNQKRIGLVTEVHIISPRSEEDKVMAKENLKKYKENKEKLKRQKELTMEQNKKRVKVAVKAAKSIRKHKSSLKTKLKESMDMNNEMTKKIKEKFRLDMASIMVGILNPYRKPDCKEGRISNTEDFKHLARKLTHFVMLKELKHCQSIEDLTCTDSVKSKAKEFVRKYMSKFGELYTRPKDDLDY